MHAFKNIQVSILAILIGTSSLSFAQYIDEIDSQYNDSFIIDPTENFQAVVEYMNDYLAAQELKQQIATGDIYVENDSSAKKEFILTVGMTDEGIKVSPSQTLRAAKSFRNYNDPVTPAEKKKIRKIVMTLGFDTILTVNSSKSELKKIGKEIDHIHPLKFLHTVFTDEELKAGIHAIRGRLISWIWDEFLGGLVGSLKEENAKNNMKPEFVQDFAKSIPINIDLIMPSIREGKFENLVNTLIDKVPRQNNTDRYNM